MRLQTLLLLALVFFCSSFAHASGYAVVTSCVAPNNTSPSSCTLTVSPNRLLVASGWFYGVGTDSFTDTLGMSFTKAAACTVHRGGASNDLMFLAWVYTGSNSGSDTITVTAASGFADVSVVEYNTGLSSGQPSSVMTIDPTVTAPCNSGTSSGAGTVTSGNLVTTAPNTLLVGYGESANTGITAGTGFTLSISPSNSISGSPVVWLPIEDSLGVATTTYSAPLNQTTDGGVWQLAVVAFPTANAIVKRRGSGLY